MGYLNHDGQYFIDVLEQDYAYLTVTISDAEGRAVSGASPDITVTGKSHVVFEKDDPTVSISNASGTFDFGIIGGAMGVDVATVTVGEFSQSFKVND